MELLLLAVLLAAPPELLVFDAPGFPRHPEDHALVAVDGARAARSVDELAELLVAPRVLVWRHGSTFPADAWPAFVKFLEAGGSFLHLGGEPFTRPVVRGKDGWVVEPRTVSLLKELRLNQCHVVSAEGTTRRLPRRVVADRVAGEDAVAAVLEPRLSDTGTSSTRKVRPAPATRWCVRSRCCTFRATIRASLPRRRRSPSTGCSAASPAGAGCSTSCPSRRRTTSCGCCSMRPGVPPATCGSTRRSAASTRASGPR